MSDTFNVLASPDKTSYKPDDLITIAIAGTNTHTTSEVVTHQTGQVTTPLTATPSGAQSTITATFDVATTTPGTTTTEQVLIDTALFNPNQGGRTWTVSADRKSITAVA